MEKEFIGGLRTYPPKEKAPDFVKGDIVISRDEMIEWLRQQDEEVRCQILESKKGSLYIAVNTWKPSQNAPVTQQNSF